MNDTRVALKDRIKFGLKAAVSVLLLGYLASRLDWKAVASLEPDMLVVILFGALIFMLALCLMSVRWKLILDRIASRATDYSFLVRAYTKAQFFNLLMPGSIGGDVVRTVSVAGEYSLAHKIAFAVTFSERLFGLSAVCIMIVVGFAFYPAFFQAVRFETYLVVVAAAGAVAAFFAARYLANLSSIIPMSAAAGLLLISASAQLADVMIALSLAQYFELSIGLTELLIVIPVVYMVTILPISLGGLGVREGAMVALLATFEIGESTAIIMAFSLYLTKCIVGLLGGLLYLLDGKDARV